MFEGNRIHLLFILNNFLLVSVSLAEIDERDCYLFIKSQTQVTMRSIERRLTVSNHDDLFFHPLWLGIFMLICVITFIGTICYIRVRCGSQLCRCLKKLFRRQTETKDNRLNDGRVTPKTYAYNWPSSYTSQSQSPKLYTLVRNIRRANLQKQLAIEIEPEIAPQVEEKTRTLKHRLVFSFRFRFHHRRI